MNAITEKKGASGLAAHDGLHRFSALEVILKATLESEYTISLVAGPAHEPFQPLFDIARTPATIELLGRHETKVVPTHDPSRAVRLSLHAAQSGRRAIVLVPNRWLNQSLASITDASHTQFEGSGAVCLILEDHPALAPAACPRRATQRLGLPCLEPSNLKDLRRSLDDALRLSRAGRCPIALVVHSSLLRSSSTLEAYPNRVPHPAEVVLPRKRRDPKPRWGGAGGVMRMARRLEINRFQATPNPGERVGVGFIAVGPANSALQHLAQVFGVRGRIPILKLGLVNPLDDVAVSRLLMRCEQAVVLEPRPGAVEQGVLHIAEMLRRRGERPATIWGRELPPRADGEPVHLETDVDLHPSVLIRRISHLIQEFKPAGAIDARLSPDPPVADVVLPPRSAAIGPDAALGAVHDLLVQIDGWLDEEAPLEERSLPGSSLAIDGREPVRSESRVVQVETWGHRQFEYEGLAALMHAAHEDRPWLFVVTESSDSAQDFERLARGAIPADRVARVRVEAGNLDDVSALEETLREATLGEALTVVIVRDGPPPRYDVAGFDRILAEVDRLGYQPRQRVVRTIDQLCTLQSGGSAPEPERGRAGEPRPLETKISIEQYTRRSERTGRMRLKPMLEQIEVVRTRPPARIWRHEMPSRLPIPTPLHARQGQWRVHLAGYRSGSPGIGAQILGTAGRLMGYAVQTIHDPTPIGAGRRAWAQLLFTRAPDGEEPGELVANIPYGEADLIIGLDPLECGRALGPDRRLRVADATRTHAIVNVGIFSDEAETEEGAAMRVRLGGWIRQSTLDEARFIDDVAGACRQAFRSDRGVDAALLGVAFQRGLIPITLDAATQAAQQIERLGFGGLVDAFEFGRRLALGRDPSSRPRATGEEDVGRQARRFELSLAHSGWGRAIRASRFRGLVDRSLKATPGLAESDAGRRILSTFVLALHQCFRWGGFEYAERFGDLITQLYHADRGDKGRLVTRHAVLPLAEVMLIRDPIYLATLVSGSEQRRLVRQRLNVKHARGDKVEFRYLTRFEYMFGDRRLRIDLRTSDWAARVIAWSRRVVPLRIRGTRRERELREVVSEAIRRATLSSVANYDEASALFRNLHDKALDGSLRQATAATLVSELELQPEGSGSEDPAVQAE